MTNRQELSRREALALGAFAGGGVLASIYGVFKMNWEDRVTIPGFYGRYITVGDRGHILIDVPTVVNADLIPYPVAEGEKILIRRKPDLEASLSISTKEEINTGYSVPVFGAGYNPKERNQK